MLRVHTYIHTYDMSDKLDYTVYMTCKVRLYTYYNIYCQEFKIMNVNLKFTTLFDKECMYIRYFYTYLLNHPSEARTVLSKPISCLLSSGMSLHRGCRDTRALFHVHISVEHASNALRLRHSSMSTPTISHPNA